MSRNWDLQNALAARQRDNLYRTRRVLESAQGPEIRVDGRHVLGFCSNDYLGLAAHPDVVRAMQDAAAAHGVGSGASALVCGHHRLHRELEEALAAFTGREACLLFSSGYLANLGVIGALLDEGDQVFEDRLNHASLIDAGRNCGARFQRYRHASPEHLDQRLSGLPAGRRLVISDGVFSMDGDLAPVPELLATCRRHRAWLMIDDAHGFGCIGEAGRGTLSHLGVAMDAPEILVGTLGKAFGAAGAFVTGSRALVETLVQSARSYIYTTAPPPAVAAAALAGLEICQRERWRRTHLQGMIRRFRQGAAGLDLPLGASETPIQSLVLGTPEAALAASEHLWNAGILVTAMRPPTVPRGTSRLRITLSAAHTGEQVDRLLQCLANLPRELWSREACA